MGMLKKVGIFLGRQILKLVFFLGIKYEPLSDPPPPVIKICEWGPWDRFIGETVRSIFD